MKKYTHAWLAFKAIERLERCEVSDSDRKYANSLIKWFKSHKDGVIQGAWYPDEIIKDMATSHVFKFTPAPEGECTFRALPSTSLIYQAAKQSELYGKPFRIDSQNNLPQRCEALAHSVIDNLRVQAMEPKGSPIAPTGNHVALILFMLSHYVADAHMPLHCDSRQFSRGIDLHGTMEAEWEDEVEKHFEIDYPNERFLYNRDSYPLSRMLQLYDQSLLKRVEEELATRAYLVDWGTGNNNVLDYMTALCQYSYLLSYRFLPPRYDESTVTLDNWRSLQGQGLSFEDLSRVVLSDAIDSIARIWLRVWRRYMQWMENQAFTPEES